jgi:hypothetical protein
MYTNVNPQSFQYIVTAQACLSLISSIKCSLIKPSDFNRHFNGYLVNTVTQTDIHEHRRRRCLVCTRKKKKLILLNR